MKKALLLIILLSVAPMLAAADQRVIVVVGDSISAGYGLDDIDQGWVRLYEQQLNNQGCNCIVHNESISGDTSGGGVARIDEILARLRPDWVLLELGGNDGLQGKPIDHIKDNLTTITQRAQASGAKVALLTMRIPPNYGPRYSDAFHDLYQEVAQSTQAIYVPFILEGVGGDPAYMQDDGIHPNQAGQAGIVRNVAESLLVD